MSKLSFVPVISVICLLHLPVQAHPLALSDSDLDDTTAAGDLCAYFGIDGPCIASMLQVMNPQALRQSQEAALALPATGGTNSLSLQASSTSPDGFRTQTATQTNSASAQAVLPFKGVDLSPAAIYMRVPLAPRQ